MTARSARSTSGRRALVNAETAEELRGSWIDAEALVLSFRAAPPGFGVVNQNRGDGVHNSAGDMAGSANSIKSERRSFRSSTPGKALTHFGYSSHAAPTGTGTSAPWKGGSRRVRSAAAGLPDEVPPGSGAGMRCWRLASPTAGWPPPLNPHVQPTFRTTSSPAATISAQRTDLLAEATSPEGSLERVDRPPARTGQRTHHGDGEGETHGANSTSWGPRFEWHTHKSSLCSVSSVSLW